MSVTRTSAAPRLFLFCIVIPIALLLLRWMHRASGVKDLEHKPLVLLLMGVASVGTSIVSVLFLAFAVLWAWDAWCRRKCRPEHRAEPDRTQDGPPGKV